MPGYDALHGRKQALIRKARKGSVFVAPTSAGHVEYLTDPTDMLLRPLPIGYRDLGWLNEDGATHTTDTEVSDVTSWGSVTPTRSDIITESVSLAVNAQETNLSTIGLYVGVAESAIKAAPNGEVRILKPLQPMKQSYHALSLAVDENEAGEIYIARYWPRAEVGEKDDQAFASGDDPVLWPVTLNARPDDEAGYAEAWLFGGPGWFAILDEMGIEVDETITIPDVAPAA
jgi:hypothetical protein